MNCIHSNQGVDRDENVIYHQGQNIKLPTRIVRTSRGSIIEWETFIESLKTTINSNKTWGGTQKFQYLKGCLSGQAKTCI